MSKPVLLNQYKPLETGQIMAQKTRTNVTKKKSKIIGESDFIFWLLVLCSMAIIDEYYNNRSVKTVSIH